MIKVKINTYGSVNREAGWDWYKELDFERKKITLKDALKAATLQDGRSLFDLVADANGIRANYSVFLNGRYMQDRRDLEHQVEHNDVITAMDYFRMLIGG